MAVGCEFFPIFFICFVALLSRWPVTSRRWGWTCFKTWKNDRHNGQNFPKLKCQIPPYPQCEKSLKFRLNWCRIWQWGFLLLDLLGCGAKPAEKWKEVPIYQYQGILAKLERRRVKSSKLHVNIHFFVLFDSIRRRKQKMYDSEG